ncbi:hypothetical protein GON01_05570 [Sphingomonas sp. MAH-20]|uniref:Tail specific protease domain-containing protein n=1 Tax=Sphingomonas horti TaxID=2682842 RepID=A0A6I4IZ25_9SPHN|nr:MULTISPECIES: S41 family peptidase [Sphingomonas]MBA2918440.1 hypothetical protein [Sphingomonas sp. CGMCC 1.13658]MVO77407.1 hypothetical protein [Sphingomonas horti]
MKAFALLSLFLAAAPAVAFDPAPWLGDLAQARQAIDRKYANLEWLRHDRGVDLDAAFARTKERLEGAQSEAEARRALERLFERFHDGHVAIRWPTPAPAASGMPPKPAPLCVRMGYNAAYLRDGTARHLAGYRAVSGDIFPAGTIDNGGTRIGVIRVGIFMPQGYPALCEQAARDLSLSEGAECDDSCSDRLITRAYELMTAAFEQRLRDLKRAGAQVLLVDISGNSGGSEWAEAAARALSRKRLQSAPLGFVRGEHWAKQWREVAAALNDARKTAAPADRAALAGWIAEANAAAAEAGRDCADGSCPRLGRAGYATGLVGSAPSAQFDGKPWAVHVFTPAQYGYHDGVWDGPVIVVVDQETWSAAEEFAAMLQDNDAAVVMGARTGGAGCGHTDGGTPTTLANSKGVLEVPDCARFRRDGSNEVNGIVPDVVVALRFDDGPGFKARLIEAKLPEAIARAEALAR